MENGSTLNVHPTEDDFEEYAFDRLPEDARVALEEHLLVCAGCQRALEEVDDYIALMKAATAEDSRDRRMKQAAPGFAWPQVRGGLSRPVLMSTAIMSMAGAVCLTMLMSRPTDYRLAAGEPPAAVSLAAFRGDESVSIARAPAGRALDLDVDVAGLPPATVYSLDLVNAAGRSEWKGRASVSEGKLQARVPLGLKPGVYWVRMYSAGELRRECGLRIE